MIHFISDLLLSISLCITLFFLVKKVTPPISEKEDPSASNTSENQSNTNATSDKKAPILSNDGANQSNSNQIKP